MPVYIYNMNALLFFLLLTSLFLISFLPILSKSKTLDYFCFGGVMIVALLFYGLRYPGATDISMYYDNYRSMTTYDKFPWGMSFFIIYKIISFFANSEQEFVLYISLFILLFTSLVIFILIKKEYKAFTLSLYIMSPAFTDMSFNTLRQGFALPFLILSVYFLYRNKYFVSLFLVAVAAGFHWNAPVVYIIAVVALFIYKKNRLVNILSSILLLMIAVSIFFNIGLAKVVVNLLSGVSGVSGGVNLDDKYDAYLGSGIDGLNFYDLDIARRIYSVGEITIYALFFKWFYDIKMKKELFPDGNRVNYYLYSVFILSGYYSVLLISMSWFFRNFYWALGFCPIILSGLISVTFDSGGNKRKLLLAIFIVTVVFSSLTTWRLAVMKMSYL